MTMLHAVTINFFADFLKRKANHKIIFKGCEETPVHVTYCEKWYLFIYLHKVLNLDHKNFGFSRHKTLDFMK